MAGRPAFENGWENFGPGLYDTAAFELIDSWRAAVVRDELRIEV